MIIRLLIELFRCTAVQLSNKKSDQSTKVDAFTMKLDSDQICIGIVEIGKLMKYLVECCWSFRPFEPTFSISYRSNQEKIKNPGQNMQMSYQ